MHPQDGLSGSIYRRGETIFRQGEACDCMYVVQAGSVEVSGCKDGQEFIIAIHGKGDFFGEVALFDYALRTAGAVASEETVLLEINRGDFNKVFTDQPRIIAKILYQMMTEMSRRLRRTNSPGGGLKF